MKIFITGATGFIGSYLAERLAETDHEMVCLVRDEGRAGKLKEHGATLVKGDVTDKDSLVEGMKGCDWVINLAGIYSFWEKRKEIFKEVNIDGTRNIMESALENNISKVIHSSSVVVYGKPETLPFTEETPVGPERFSEYARTKYEGDLIAWDLHKDKGLPLVVLYPSPVLGAGDTQFTGDYVRLVVQGKLPTLAFPNAINTFVHVKDIVEAIIRAAEKENNIGEKYIIGKERVTMQEWFIMICKIARVPIPNFTADPLIMLGATFMTSLANIIKRPPKWGLSVEGQRSSMEGVQADGSKAERELGITYTPIRKALEEMIASCRE